MIPIRVAVGLMLISTVIGFIVGAGASLWWLVLLPLAAFGFITANEELRSDDNAHCLFGDRRIRRTVRGTTDNGEKGER